MARYFYDRYTVSETTEYKWYYYHARQISIYRQNDWGAWESHGSGSSIEGYTSYAFNSESGNYSGSGGTTISAEFPNLHVYQIIGGSTLYEYYYTAGGTLMRRSRSSYFSHDVCGQGDYIGETWAPSDYYTNNACNSSQTLYYSRGSQTRTTYTRGSYIDSIIAEAGAYPTNGRSGNYWYVRGARAFPQLAVKAGDQVKQGVDGWVKKDGQLKPIQGIWVKKDGQIKQA